LLRGLAAKNHLFVQIPAGFDFGIHSHKHVHVFVQVDDDDRSESPLTSRDDRM
jgi:hypothetical protein